jgi:hypothetical protein
MTELVITVTVWSPGYADGCMGSLISKKAQTYLGSTRRC